jgi:hypothetical protein
MPLLQAERRAIDRDGEGRDRGARAEGPVREPEVLGGPHSPAGGRHGPERERKKHLPVRDLRGRMEPLAMKKAYEKPAIVYEHSLSGTSVEEALRESRGASFNQAIAMVAMALKLRRKRRENT